MECEAENAESVMKHKGQFCCTIRFLFTSGFITDIGKVQEEKRTKSYSALTVEGVPSGVCVCVCVDVVTWFLKPAPSQNRMPDVRPLINTTVLTMSIWVCVRFCVRSKYCGAYKRIPDYAAISINTNREFGLALLHSKTKQNSSN